jgi:hypothetical protein
MNLASPARYLPIASLILLMSLLSGQLSASSQPAASQPEPVTPVVGPATAPRDTSRLPVANLAESSGAEASPEVLPLRSLPRAAAGSDLTIPEQPSSELEEPASPQAVNLPDPLLNFEGLSSTSIVPPDPNGAAGVSHYVQMVNDAQYGARVAVWQKGMTTPQVIFGLSQLWPAGDHCHDYPRGDPVVLYDQLANRWLLTQFTDPPFPPYNECVAVSRSSTPTNNPADWFVYTFDVHASKFNDYPKFGIWPDAYYMSANQFVITQVPEEWAGMGVWALDRQAMLNGQPASFVYFDLETLNSEYGGLLPATLTGMTPPPANAPGYYASIDQDWNGTQDVLHLFEFHVDWANPSNSTFSLAKDLPVDPFDWTLAPGGLTYETIPQPGTQQRLDDLADRLMMHLSYRNFGVYEALVVNHTIDVNNAPPTTYGRAGVRWYEVRGGAVNDTLADAEIFQQGDVGRFNSNLSRWMGSLAMDNAGNMMLGYSVSSSSVYPGIRYTGRLQNDPAGTMPQGEQTIIDGSGVQLHYAGRWGDYSAMSVDPENDCTFWYTNEYIAVTGQINWHTRVAAFQFPGCTSNPDFFLEALPASQAVCRGGEAEFTVNLASLNGYASPVSLAASSSPTGFALALGSNPLTPPASTILNVSNTSSQPTGSYTLTIHGSDGSLDHSDSVSLDLIDIPPSPALNSPADLAENQLLLPTFSWQAASMANGYQLQVATDPGFNNQVVSATGLSGTSFTLLSPLAPSTSYYWRVQAENNCGDSFSPVRQFTTGGGMLYLPVVLDNAYPAFPSSLFLPPILKSSIP